MRIILLHKVVKTELDNKYQHLRQCWEHKLSVMVENIMLKIYLDLDMIQSLVRLEV